MNVGQLKEYLKDVPDNYTITAEGCDCEGLATGIVVDNAIEDVLIARYTQGMSTQDSPPALAEEINIWRDKKNL